MDTQDGLISDPDASCLLKARENSSESSKNLITALPSTFIHALDKHYPIEACPFNNPILITPAIIIITNYNNT